MQLASAIKASLDDVVASLSHRQPGVRDLAEMIGGGSGRKQIAAGNKAIAAEFGVDVRTVQRYAKYERAIEQGQTPAKSDRNIEHAAAGIRDKFRELQGRHAEAFSQREKGKAIAELKSKPLEADFSGVIQDPSGNQRNDDKVVTIPTGAALDDIIDAYAEDTADSRAAMERRFNDAFFSAWGRSGHRGPGSMASFAIVDVSGLDLTPLG